MIESDITEAKVTLAADITKARSIAERFGLALVGVVVGWIVAKIF